MKVLNIGTSEMEIIKESLDYLGGTYNGMIQAEQDEKTKEEMKYKEAHIRTTGRLIKDARLQELCEKCLSFFWDRLIDGGSAEWTEIDYLVDQMGIEDEELMELFKEAGFEK